MAKSNDTPMQDILRGISNGTTCLPDFQRGWVWDDERIRGLIASITCSYPLGAVMFLEYGGDSVRFKTRLFTNVIASPTTPEFLVLDGQQRLTSVFCAMYSKAAVSTQNNKKENIKRFYYLDIVRCLDPNADRFDCIVSIPEDKMIREDFGRRVTLDLSTRESEYREHMFPLNIVYDTSESNAWKNGYRKFHHYDETMIARLDRFDETVLSPILLYTLPVIRLDKSTPKEAVCQVFENVNTGGMALTVFELVTATFATEDFVLRDDWDKRETAMNHASGTFDLLSVIANTDFLTSMTLLAQAQNGKTLSCKRKDVLSLRLSDYKAYADEMVNGYIRAARFLVQQSILTTRDLPYTTQFVPLSVLMTMLGKRSEDGTIKEKLIHWYWSGVFGEMYGSANETRYANDVSGVLAWIDGGDEPDTVARAFFHPIRLLSLQTRNGAAYKGVMALILLAGARDFISGSKMDFTNFIDGQVDIHHVFPQKHCEQKGYDKRKWNSIINKTPLTARTNRTIGGNAPSQYLRAIEGNVTVEALNANIESHLIDVSSLRQDDFDTFFALRARAILKLIGKAMGKTINNLDSTDVIDAFGVSLE